MLDVDVHEARVVVPKRVLAFDGLFSQKFWPAIEAGRLENTSDAVAIEVWQEVADDEGRLIDGKFVSRRSVQTIARSSSVAFQGSRGGRSE